MGKARILKSFPLLQKAFPDSVLDAEYRGQFEAAMETVSYRTGADRPFKTEVKASELTLKNLFSIAWERLVTDQFASDASMDAEMKKLLLRLKHGSADQAERSGLLLLHSGKSGKTIRLAWDLLKEIESIHWSVFNASVSAQKGSPPDLISRGMGTCSCCFGEYHVQKETMVRHGQRKVVDYMWSATCGGVNFPPLEISTEGLEDNIDRHEKLLQQLIEQREFPERITTLSVKLRTGEKQLARGDDGFDKALDAHASRLRRDIKDITADVEVLRERLEHWQLKHEANGVAPKT